MTRCCVLSVTTSEARTHSVLSLPSRSTVSGASARRCTAW